MNRNRGNGAKFPLPLVSPPWPPLRFLEDSLWSPLGTVKNRWGDSLWLVGFGRSGVWSLWGTGSLTPKLGCRTGRWCKNDPQIRVSDRSMMQKLPQIWVSGRSMMQEWPPNLTSELSGRWKWPPNLMPGVLDCFTSLAMTGGGTGLLHFARNDGRGGWIATLRSQWRGEGGLEKVKHWKSLKKIVLSLFGNILSWVFSWVMNLKMKKSKWLPVGFWADFDTTFSRLFTGANLVALGFSGLYCAIYWILERIYSSLFAGLLGVYSIIGNGSLEGELLQRWLPAGDAFFPNMWYLSVIGLAVVSLSFVIAQLVNKRKGNLTRFSFWLMLFFFVLLALPYIGMFCNGISYFLQQ